MAATRTGLLGLVAIAAVLSPLPAAAHSGGQPGPGCVGCHGGGDVDIALVTAPSSIDPGETVTVTLTVSAPGSAVAGVFVEADVGELQTLGGEGLATVAAGLTHSAPKPMPGGVASFDFLWTAPAQPGAVRLSISALAANGNGSSSGDHGDDADIDLVFGCSAQQYFLDFDGDGYGRDDAPRLGCANTPPPSHAAAGGDCDDTRDTVHPGADELCNQRDDDCDADVDEDAIPITLYPDGDGDGYYGAVEGSSTDTQVGCVGTPGYAGEPGDCEPNDPSMHPDAQEVCNLYDDNCDGRVDERVRPICGVGWCAREAWTCEPDDCEPGEPTPETCNLLDDDCDDELDEDVVCEGDAVCIAGECRAGEDAGGGSGSGSGGSSGGGEGSGSTDDGAAATSQGRSRCALVSDRRAGPGMLAIVVVVLALARRRRSR
ncbi:MAG: hypothetical protein K1X88_01335 [Nannocystaceae bacterium]|nr:hypothetical protein [Nannocystaceae bacterium]